jgi:hypothetical protein
MKYSLRYNRADDQSVKEYEKRIEQIQTTDKQIYSVNLNEMIPENFPKKLKKPEFQVITSNESISNLSQPKKDNIFFLSSTSNNKINNNDNSNNSNLKLDDPKNISTLINNMKKENKIEQRLNISNMLNKIEKQFCLVKFMQLNGAVILGDWISDYKDTIEEGNKVDVRIYDILTNILNFCDNLPVTVSDLKSSKIGRKINKLGKCVSDRTIKLKCEQLVKKWRKTIDELKDKKKSSNDNRHSEEKEFEPILSKKVKREDTNFPDRKPDHHHNYQQHQNLQLSDNPEPKNKKYITIHLIFFTHLLKANTLNTLKLLFISIIRVYKAKVKCLMIL